MGIQVGILLDDTGRHSDLAEGLKAAGIGVDILVMPHDLSEEQSLMLGRSFLESAGRCDLIHNLSGCRGLLFAGLSRLPFVTSITGDITDAEVRICRAITGSCFFVTEEAQELGGLRTVPGIGRFQGDRVGFYLDVYSRVLALGKQTEHRPWGKYEILSEDRDDHKVKRITVLPGKRLSLQYHGQRREHWVIISGRATATVGDRTIELGPSETIDIPCGAKHRIENAGPQDLIFIEVQQGDYFGEDDIVRIEDDFGRI